MSAAQLVLALTDHVRTVEGERKYHIPIGGVIYKHPSGVQTEYVRNTGAELDKVSKELDAQGVPNMHPVRGVLNHGVTTAHGHLAVARTPDGKIAGLIKYQLDKQYRRAEVLDVRVIGADNAVASTHHGVGTALLRQIARHAGEQYMGHKYHLRVAGAVHGAKPFYAKTGADFDNPSSGGGQWSVEATRALAAGMPAPRKGLISKYGDLVPGSTHYEGYPDATWAWPPGWTQEDKDVYSKSLTLTAAERDELDQLVLTLALTTVVGPTISLDRSPKSNWVEASGGLPNYIRRIAKHLLDKGMSMSHAIATAISQCKKWAAGGKDVHPDTVVKASAAIAEWEKLKATAGAKRAAKKVSLSAALLTRLDLLL